MPNKIQADRMNTLALIDRLSKIILKGSTNDKFFKYKTMGILFCFFSQVAILNIQAQQLPMFKFVGRSNPAISIVVSPKTTKGELKMLIYEFRKARIENTLSRMIPATIPGGSGGDYFGVWIFVLSEYSWASTDKLKKFLDEDRRVLSDIKFCREYAKHIRAVYYYTLGMEYGNLGYEDEDGRYRTKGYKKLF
jgi:hypothetical protein